MLKYVFAFILFVCSLSLHCEENYSIVVGTYDINDTENLKFILELKKFVPKENSVVIYDSNYYLSKNIIVDNFKSDKEANEFNEKLKVEYKSKVVNSFIVSSDAKIKLLKEGVSPKFKLLMVKSKNDLPLKVLNEKFKDSLVDIVAKSNEFFLKVPVSDKGLNLKEESKLTDFKNEISNILNENKVLDFNFEIKDFTGYEIATVLAVTVYEKLPIKELIEKFKPYLIEEKLNKKGELLLRLSVSGKELNKEEIISTSNLINELSKLFLNSLATEFTFTIQKYKEKEDKIIYDKDTLVEKNTEDNHLDGPVLMRVQDYGESLGYRQRFGGGRKRAVMLGGGTKATELAVNNALQWLANNQEKDGHWDSGKFGGAGTPEIDAAATASALLAFLGVGHTDKIGKWKPNIKSAIEWLIKSQKPNGSWDAKNYANGFCALALAEVVGMDCGGKEAKKSAELAIDYLLSQQNTTGFFDYIGPSARNDMSATSWCISAYNSAMLAGIKVQEIKDALKKCGEFLDKAEGTRDNSPTSEGLGWYTPDSTGTGGSGGACQAIAILIRQYIGWAKIEPWMVAATNGQLAHIPTSYDGADIYRVYYASLVFFQIGGKHWDVWNEYLKKTIVDIQRQDGDLLGSWDKTGCQLDKGGRVMYTALLCLTLEVYYRYPRFLKD